VKESYFETNRIFALLNRQFLGVVEVKLDDNSVVDIHQLRASILNNTDED
jgi:hypothetical protein